MSAEEGMIVLRGSGYKLEPSHLASAKVKNECILNSLIHVFKLDAIGQR